MKETLQYQWAEQAFEVRIRQSRRARHVHLRVLAPGLAEVVMPPGASLRRAPEIVAQHRRWLVRTLARVARERGGETSPLVPPSRVELQAIGHAWEIDYRPVPSGGRCREPVPGRLEVFHGPEGEAWRAALNRWLADSARRHLVPWLDRVSETVALPYEGVTIRGQKTRWGSCSVRRRINLNYRLLFLPPPLVEYLFVHELCHTAHLNHSTAFWALVGEKIPDYRLRDREMRKAGRHVPVWALPL